MSNSSADTRRYIIMGANQLDLPKDIALALPAGGHQVAVAARNGGSPKSQPELFVIDAISESGPKLVEMKPEGELSLRLAKSGIKIVPEIFYNRQWERVSATRSPQPLQQASSIDGRAMARLNLNLSPASFQIKVVSATDRSPLPGAYIAAFTDFAHREGANATTAAAGIAKLHGIDGKHHLDRIYVYSPAGYWGFFATAQPAHQTAEIALQPIDLTDVSLLLPQFFVNVAPDAGAGVTIGIIDSGVDGAHPDLGNVTGGRNCVSLETAPDPAAVSAWGPAKIDGEHGTHVAGAAAATGRDKLRGVAPGATLRSYRVFPHTGGGASSYDILKAITAAIDDKCDIINMSIGGGEEDELTRLAIQRALDAGIVVVVAAGNDGRKPVSYPAAFPGCVAVSAMGRAGTFPGVAIGTSEIADPRGKVNNHDFVASFSNIGARIDVIGPGVEIVSTLPDGHYGTMSGTSMAAPAIAGMCAVLLAGDPSIRQKTGAQRSRALKDRLYALAKPLGFGRDYEGFGMPLSPQAGA